MTGVVLITGCSSGFGLEIAAAFAARGDQVVATLRDPARGEVLPHMRARRSGRIVFLNAIGGLLNTPYLGAYCASKHALDGLAATLDIELRPFGLRVSSVLPSAFHTHMADNLQAYPGEGTDYESATREYHAGLSGRIREGPSDLSPVVQAVIEAATSPDPRPRYLVAPHLASVLDPLVETLEALHARELALAPH
jgi:NAD(P)-dependent dehydrogenase (short-subunit alcohol dehydrogenase family)